MRINYRTKEETIQSDSSFPILLLENELQENHPLQMHWHSDIEFIYVNEGKAEYTINGYNETVEKGDLIIINPTQIHQANVISNCPVRNSVIIMNYYFLKSEIHDIVNQKYINPLVETKYIFHNVVRDEEIIDLFLSMKKEIASKREGYQLRIKAKMYCFISLMFERNYYYYNKSFKRKKEIESADSIRLSLEYIHSNYQSHISLDELSKHLSISKYHLCRIFKSMTGSTINQYLNNYRLSQAAKLLENTSKNITEITYEVGYNNDNYFISRFKEEYQVTPFVYRKINKV